MHIAVISAAGKQGSLLVAEALQRGHNVTAFVRKEMDRKKIADGAEVVVKDILALTSADIKDFDVVIDAFGTWAPETLHLHSESLQHLSDLVAGKPIRLLVVGGAGSLYVDPEMKTRLMDLPSFPSNWLPMAKSMGAAFDDLKKRKDVEWTYVSPSANFHFEGERTSSYKLGSDFLLADVQGNSEISYADYAIAMLDEAENAKHVRERITVCKK